MDISKMVIRCIETLKAGPYPRMRVVEINWEAWDEDRTSEIRCVFRISSPGLVCCVVYPSISGTHGVILTPRTTWSVVDEVLLREEE